MCAKLDSSAVFVSCVSTKRSGCVLQSFLSQGMNFRTSWNLFLRGTPAKIFRVNAVQGKCERCCVGSDVSSPRSAMLGRDGQSEVATF